MAEYIEREKYLRWSDINDALIEHHGEQVMSKYLTVAECKAAKFGIEGALYVLEYLPAADVAPVVHGRWKPVLEGVWNLPTPICVGWSCSLCGRYEQYKEPYCNCGAKMDGE